MYLLEGLFFWGNLAKGLGARRARKQEDSPLTWEKRLPSHIQVKKAHTCGKRAYTHMKRAAYPGYEPYAIG